MMSLDAARLPTGSRVALIELLEPDGRIARSIDVWAWPVTIGRALDNSVVLADPYAAAHHARIDGDEQGDVTLTVFSSLNGVRDLNAGSQHTANDPRLRLPAGGTTLQIGATHLRLRLPSEVLVPEQALPPRRNAFAHDTPALQRALPWLAGAALLALEVGSHWVGLDPGADYTSWLSLGVATPLAIAGWAAAWGLLSKIFQHKFDFWGHLRIALPWLLLVGLIDALWPQVAAALSAPWLWRLSTPAQVVALALLVRAHLTHVAPSHGRAITAGLGALLVVGAGVSVANTQRSFDALMASPYMATLPMPALRLASSVPASELVQAMAPLASQLAKRVKKAREDEEEDSAEPIDD
jgi:FHA domain